MIEMNIRVSLEPEEAKAIQQMVDLMNEKLKADGKEPSWTVEKELGFACRLYAKDLIRKYGIKK